MGSHRADRRGSRRSVSGSRSSTQPDVGRRRASRHSASKGPLFRALPSPPVLAGVAVLAVSVGGALTSGVAPGQLDAVVATSASSALVQPGAMAGTSKVAKTNLLAGRAPSTVSRDASRDVTSENPNTKLVQKAETAARERNQALAQLGKQAERQAAKIKANLWVMPLTSYRLSAGFGATSYLWSSFHTGLDLSAPSGTPIMAIANGVVTEVGYDGSYGNKTVVTLEDGTELWFCHQSSYAVTVGDSVRGGEVIGYVGSTGNTTGPHLHLEVHPGAGDAVDPYAALVAHGLHP